MESVGIFISEEAIRQRIAQLAAQIQTDFKGQTVYALCALKGAFVFMADLMRALPMAVEMDFIGTSSYGDEKAPSGQIRLTKDVDFDICGKHVLLVEDILDTGHTLAFLRKHLQAMNPASLRACVLLDKPERRVWQDVQAEYVGFTIPDRFVVGYGLDYAQRYRNLPYIGVLQI